MEQLQKAGLRKINVLMRVTRSDIKEPLYQSIEPPLFFKKIMFQIANKIRKR